MKRFLRRTGSLVLVAVGLHAIAPANASAMHISEGILPIPWAFFWFAVAAPFVGMGLFRLKAVSRDDLASKPLVGFIAAVVFIVSCIPIPVPVVGTCSHPCGTAISAILLGPALSVLAAGVALLMQALFLGHGGLSTLGANIMTMGVVGSFTGFFVFRLIRALGAGPAVAGFAAGLCADWMTYFSAAFILACGLKGTGEPFLPLLTRISLAFVPTQLPLGILEGAMTGGMVALLCRKRLDLLVRMKVLRPEEARP